MATQRSSNTHGSDHPTQSFPPQSKEDASSNKTVVDSSSEPQQVVSPQAETLTEDNATTAPVYLPTVEGYEILGILGQGGMGVVYKARQEGLDREVALKMIRDGVLAGEDHLKRFAIEARAVARLQHTNVVHIYEISEQEGRPYFSLELVNGGNLAEKLENGSLSLEDSARLIETLARAVHHAHSHGVIHRDLKPANVLLTEDGTPKITDFGLAKQLEAEVFLTHTATGHLLGTPSYMAPEQAWGKNRDVGPTADVYALGAILYECLTGRPPFVAERIMEVLDQVRSKDPEPLRKLNPQCPVDLETICLKCLEKDPARRYGTARELAEDLERFQKGESIRARPASLWERGRKWVQRRPTTVSMMAVATVAIVLFGFQFLLFLNPPGEGGKGEGYAANGPSTSPPVPEKRPGTLQGEQYQSLIVQAERMAESNPVNARKLLAQAPEDLQGWEWQYLTGLTSGLVPRSIQSNQGYVSRLLFEPATGQPLAIGSEGKLTRFSLDGNKDELLYEEPGKWITAFALSPDGKKAAIATWEDEPIAPELPGEKIPEPKKEARSDILLSPSLFAFRQSAHPLRNREVMRDVMPWPGIQEMALAPPAVVLPPPRGIATVKILDRKSWKLEKAILTLGMPVSCMAYHAEGDHLAIATGWLPEIPPLSDGAPDKKEDTGSPKSDKKSTMAPRGFRWEDALVLFEEEPGKDQSGKGGQPSQKPPQQSRPVGGVQIWSMKKMEASQTFGTFYSGSPIWLAFDPRSLNHLAVVDSRGGLEIRDITTGKTVDLPRTKGFHSTLPLTSVAWNPVRKELAIGGMDSTVRLWSEKLNPLLVLREHTEGVLCVGYDPSGKRMASGSRDKTVKVWNAETGFQLLTLRGHNAPVTQVAFSPDGKWLLSSDASGEVRIWNPTEKGPQNIAPGRGGRTNPPGVPLGPSPSLPGPPPSPPGR